MMIATGEEMLREDQAAAMIGIRPGTLTAWRNRGSYDLPFVKVGRLVRYRRSDVEAWLERRTATAVARCAE